MWDNDDLGDDFDERNIDDVLYGKLPEGNEQFPTTQNEQESINAFNEMFGRAR